MGLPMWRAPSPEAGAAPKTDPTALARSPIRRRRPARSPPSPRLLSHQSAFEDAVRRFREPTARPSSTSATARPRLPPPPVPEPRNYARRGELRYTPAPPADADADDDDESSARSYFHFSTHAPHRLSVDDRRPLPALTPNFAPAAASRAARHDSPYARERERERSARRHRSPYLLPAELLHMRASRPVDSRGTGAPRRGSATEHSDDGDDANSDSNAVGFPPLRRMGRRNIADGPLPSSSLRESWSPATTVDGLGDRERSISPVMDDHWETMLSSVAPDPLAPTAESSFASAAASASFSNSHPSSRAGSSNSNSASSSRTHLTVPSRGQSFILDQFLHVCETSDDSASDTEADDEDMHRDFTRLHHSLSQRFHDRTRDSAAFVRSFFRGVGLHEEALRPASRQAPALQSTSDQLYEPVADTYAEERGAVDNELPLDQELRDARALLERLSRRDNVPDEFWASVGLRRPLADRLERVQHEQRERL